ncbi:hypothetical protein IW262DRAFT_565620 [Armillaria fumosa]|nr:hypothetical protein IW262DRAFT_565620 [Armillaria fumosa]
MNSMPAGTRVFFWDTRGQIIRGVVQSTSVGADGTLMVVINSDGGRTITLPMTTHFVYLDFGTLAWIFSDGLSWVSLRHIHIVPSSTSFCYLPLPHNISFAHLSSLSDLHYVDWRSSGIIIICCCPSCYCPNF